MFHLALSIWPVLIVKYEDGFKWSASECLKVPKLQSEKGSGRDEQTCSSVIIGMSAINQFKFVVFLSTMLAKACKSFDE